MMSLPGAIEKTFSTDLREYNWFMRERDIFKGGKSWVYVKKKKKDYIFKKRNSRLVLKRRFVCKFKDFFFIVVVLAQFFILLS